MARRGRVALAGALLAALAAPALSAQTDWPVYGHDAGGMRYSPLKQVNSQNVAQLRLAWTYHTGETGHQFECTPLVVGNTMYASTQQNRIVALDASTGKEIWKYDPKIRTPRESRGVAYWPGDKSTAPRIVFGTADGRLIALDAKTGRKIDAFGDNGEVDLRAAVADRFPKAGYAITSPPAIYRDLAIVAPSTQEGPSLGPSGDPRAFDIRTGKQVWRFHTVPQPGEPGSETWGPDGHKDRSGPSLWGLINVDTARGLVFLAIGNPADSFYGGDRLGTNLYANSVVALDAATGKLRWYYQLVHHDIFDYDVPGGPALIDVMRAGRKLPAVAQITKTGLLFLLDRMTGEPIFGVEERPVPKSDVPGEQAWPTQPFPVKPLPLARTGITRDELTTRTPEAARFCRELFDKMRIGSPYTPFGTQATLLFPGLMGGGNWGGVSFDPGLGYVFVNTSDMGGMGRMVPAAAGAPEPYRNETAYARFLDPDRYPCQKPPWGQLTAVNANTGDIAWKVPLGNFDELAGQGLGQTGTPNSGGSIATAGGLVFIAATNDQRLRAFESATGKEVWTAKLDASGNATPVTYLGQNGRQYVAIAAGGPDHLRTVGDASHDNADSIMAFALDATAGPVQPSTATAKKAPSGGTKPGLPDAPGKEYVLKICGQCHSVDVVAQTRMSREEWKGEVDSMVSRGASGTPAELRKVVDYLGKHLAPVKAQ